MLNKETVMKIGDIYEGFKVLDVRQEPDYNSEVLYLKHERTGLEVVHMHNADKENLFAIAVKTPVTDSKGAAHVLEHSVLCGSERYPVKDPFLRLTNQSVNTYLNAYTSIDCTVFPASSVVKKDFFNLFSVYADAVFFPLLRPETFLQECHRLELDDTGKPVIQGVVYNEMKGNYSSFDRVASIAIENVMYSGTNYLYDQGGDPLSIPELSLEELKAFHKKHYCPANSIIFLYGDISTEEQLSFIKTNITDRIKDGGTRVEFPACDLSVPIPERMDCFGPADDHTGNEEAASSAESMKETGLVWRLNHGIENEDIGSFFMKLLFIDELLWGDDSAPVSKAVLDAGVGENISSETGVELSGRYPLLTFVMQGVPEEKEAAFRSVFMESLRSICKNGISKEDFDRAVMTFDFANREIKRPDGSPYSMVLMRRVIKSWLYGGNPFRLLSYRRLFEQLKSDMRANPHLIEDEIQRLILDNKELSFVTVTPSHEWNEKRLAQEQQIAEHHFVEKGKDEVLRELDAMHAFQNMAEDDSVVPRLDIQDLPTDVEKFYVKEERVGHMPFYVSTEPTNGIVTFDAVFPLDLLTPEDYLYVPFLGTLVAQMGWGNTPWDVVMKKLGGLVGSFGAAPRSFNVAQCYKNHLSDYPYLGRDWMCFRFDVLEENTPQVMELLGNCLRTLNFDDTARLKDLLASYANYTKSSVLPSAHIYAMYRTSRKESHCRAVFEMWDGLTSVDFTVKMQAMDLKVLAQRLKDIFEKIVKAGCLLHVTGTEQGVELARKALPAFIEKNHLVPPCERKETNLSDFVALTEFSGTPGGCEAGATPEINEVFTIPGSIGFAAVSYPSSDFDTDESVEDAVFDHILTTTTLWNKVRTEGGAYGVYLNPNNVAGWTRFITYRDPKPFDSLHTVEDVFNTVAEAGFTKEEVEKAITGSYSDEIAPVTPSSRGGSSFFWILGGLNNDLKERHVRRLLAVTPESIQRAAVRFRNSVPDKSETVVLCSKDMLTEDVRKNVAKICTLPL